MMVVLLLMEEIVIQFLAKTEILRWYSKITLYTQILIYFHLPIEDGNILQSVWATRIFIASICVWAWTGFYVLVLNSAIQGIDKNIIHAAKLDRASTMVIYKKIVFPSISPSILLATVLATCSAFQMYVEIALITISAIVNLLS